MYYRVILLLSKRIETLSENIVRADDECCTGVLLLWNSSEKQTLADRTSSVFYTFILETSLPDWNTHSETGAIQLNATQHAESCTYLLSLRRYALPSGWHSTVWDELWISSNPWSNLIIELDKTLVQLMYCSGRWSSSVSIVQSLWSPCWGLYSCGAVTSWRKCFAFVSVWFGWRYTSYLLFYLTAQKPVFTKWIQF